jgi:hypothetical protein
MIDEMAHTSHEDGCSNDKEIIRCLASCSPANVSHTNEEGIVDAAEAHPTSAILPTIYDPGVPLSLMLNEASNDK